MPEHCVQGDSLLSRSTRHVLRAAQNPVPLDDRQVSAVAARIELDLRLGVIFTRFTTLTLKALGGELAEQRIISYGEDMRNVKTVIF